MNILFRILVVLTLIVNGVCLWFAKELEVKRQWLLDCNTVLAQYWGDLAPRIESNAAFGEGENQINLEATAEGENFAERDISETNLASADMEPQYNDFWAGYPIGYEAKAEKSMSVDQELLKEVYELDAENKPVVDAAGRPNMDGTPLKNQLDPILRAASAQRDRLNETRTWLEKLRVELVDTITELNNVKTESRQRVKTIEERDNTISTLEGEKAELQSEVADLTTQVEDLEADKTALEGDLAAKEEELLVANDEIEKLKKVIAEIVANEGKQGNAKANLMANIPAGVKGQVVRADNEYNFCIVKLAPDVYNELVGEDGSKELPEIPFYVKSPGAEGTMAAYKATVTLTGVAKEPYVVTCKIVGDYRLEDIKPGDELYTID
ncbi:MAG: hypothetical protein Q4F99_04240 [bacterium]|nr:hypothetical protein [bacterium]